MPLSVSTVFPVFLLASGISCENVEPDMELGHRLVLRCHAHDCDREPDPDRNPDRNGFSDHDSHRNANTILILIRDCHDYPNSFGVPSSHRNANIARCSDLDEVADRNRVTQPQS